MLWDSQDDTNHFREKAWEPGENPTFGRFNLKHRPLVNPKNILQPPLYIKTEVDENLCQNNGF